MSATSLARPAPQTSRPGSPADGRAVLTDFFGPVAQEYGERMALRWRHGYRHFGVTFNELARSIQAAGQRLQAVGVEPGDRVLLLGANGPEWAVAFFGIVL